MIDKVLRRILDSGIASGDFAEDLDVDAAIRIINALVVGKRMQRVTRSSLEEFVLRGLGAQV